MIIEKISFIWAGIWTLDLQFYALASYPLDYWDTYTNSEKNSLSIVFQSKILVNVMLYYNSILRATQQVGTLS